MSFETWKLFPDKLLIEFRGWILHARGENALHVAVPVEALDMLVDALQELRVPLKCGHPKACQVTENCNTPECPIKDHRYCAFCAELDKVKYQLTQSTERITALEAQRKSLDGCFEAIINNFGRLNYSAAMKIAYTGRALLAPTVPPETTIDPGSQYGHSKSQDKRLRSQGKPEPPAEKEKP